MKNTIIIAAFSITTLLSCTNSNSKVTELSPQSFNDSMVAYKDLKIIDIRTPQEFASGSLDNAVNIDYNAPSFKDNLEWLDKTSPVYIYCQSGSRSTEAIAVFKELSFDKIYVLKGGLLAWKNNKLPFTEVADKNVASLQDPESVSPQNFQKIIEQQKNVVFDFKAEWCGPCKKIAPVLAKLEKENAGKFIVYKIDTDKSQELARSMNINSIPHLMIYKDGKKVEDIIGFANESQLQQQVLKHF